MKINLSSHPSLDRPTHRLEIFSWVWTAILVCHSLSAPPTAWGQNRAGVPDAVLGRPTLGADQDPAGLDKEIASWIAKLADPNYAVRLQAQSELSRIGVRALDQLHQASFHPDPQIASQARFLVRSNQFNWAWGTDPFTVRRILANYSNAPIYEKSVYIDQLDQLERDEGLAPLCRLIRYETQGCLAKRAALRVLRHKPQIDQSLAERKAVIEELLKGAVSTAGLWVLTYATSDAISPQPWLDAIEKETQLLQAKSPDASIEVIADLRRWLAEQMNASSDQSRQQTLDIARRIPEHFSESSPGYSVDCLEFAQWALETKLVELVQEQHDRMSNLALLDPRFGYLLAESYLIQEKKEIAERIVELTLARVQVGARGEVLGQDNSEQDTSAFNRRLQEMLQRNASLVFERASTSRFLIQRGLFDWAEKELRIAIQGHEDDVEYATIINLDLLSRLLHDTSRNGEAAEVLQKYVDRYEREPMFQNQVANQSRDSLVSYYYLYRGDDAREKGDSAQARKMYLKSIETSHENVDAIIGLYRLDDASEQAVAERKKIQREVMNLLKKEIAEYENNLRRDNLRMQATDLSNLANQMNTLAWLVCNTEGNLEEALFLSRKACAMDPNRSAYLDTLAHCYASLGRYREAVEQQRKAVALEPHQPSLSSALKRFEAKLQEQPGA